MQTKTNNLVTISVAVVFFSSIMTALSVGTVNAASIPTTFSSEQDCNTKVGAATLTRVKSYGNNRYKTRKAALTNYEKGLETTYGKFDQQINKSVENGKNLYKASGLSVPATLDYKGERNKAVNHKNAIKSKLNTTQASLETKKKSMDGATTSAGAAKQVCGMIYDLRVFTYWPQLISKQRNIDGMMLKVQINETSKAYTESYYNSKKAKIASASAAKAKSLVDSLPSSLSQMQQIDSMQAELNKITPEVINANEPKQSITDRFNKAVGKELAVGTAIQTDKTQLTQKRSDLKKIVRASTVKKKAKTNNSSSKKNDKLPSCVGDGC